MQYRQYYEQVFAMMDEIRSPRLVGARVLRVEDRRLLTGCGRFVADIALDRMLSAKFVRADLAHGNLTGVDVSAGLSIDGVRAVFVGSDFADHEVRCVSSYEGFQPSGQPILAVDRVRFVGEAVAMVVADDEYVAEDGCDAVIVDIEALTPILSRRKPWPTTPNRCIPVGSTTHTRGGFCGPQGSIKPLRMPSTTSRCS